MDSRKTRSQVISHSPKAVKFPDRQRRLTDQIRARAPSGPDQTTRSLTMFRYQAAVGLGQMLDRTGLEVVAVPGAEPIPGSWWGGPEAGLIGNRLFVREDTPLHSALHEACHYICMTGARRLGLHTDAGGDDAEENAVCYLQLCIAEQLPGVGAARLCRDMDAWGYSFRLGSAWAWYRHDAEDARLLLLDWGLITPDGAPTWRCRR
jgi:hypothetical protein